MKEEFGPSRTSASKKLEKIEMTPACIAPLEYRNAPISGLGKPQVQLLMSRMLKSKLLTIESLLKPQVVDNPQKKLQHRSDKQKIHYDWNAKVLPSIKEGEAARVRKGKTWEPVIVTAQHTAPRSYILTSNSSRNLPPPGGEGTPANFG